MSDPITPEQHAQGCTSPQAGKSEPEGDVLEEQLRHRAEWDTDEATQRLCLDAIAEIESRGKIIHDLLATNLRYTEAEPVRWEYYKKDLWNKCVDRVHANQMTELGYWVRALIVKPEGDTGGGET